MSYGQRLKHAIDLAKSSRKELAVSIGVTEQAIGLVIRGATVALTAENSARAARHLRVDSHWLATGEGEPRPMSEKWPYLSFGPGDYYALDESLRNEVEDRLAGAIIRMKREKPGELTARVVNGN